jgi:checkpoint serine/threonine-protein kinase
MNDLIDFDMVESQKENIAPVQSGHSASALARTFGKDPLSSRSELDTQRASFEKQIAESEELDDPIQPYLDYIKYINELCPQGHTAENGLVQILERCTSQFRDAPYYKDDSRYLKVWIQYAKYSDAPKELYTYLCRKEIGRNLSLFYEEFAAFLESVDRKNQARDVYLAGMELNARPIERLRRRYKEFCERLEISPPNDNEPKSPTFAPIRAALAVKDTTGSELSSSRPESVTRNLSVFQDSTENNARAESGSAWDIFGSMSQRRKENIMEAKAWEGEKLLMDPDYAKKPIKSMSIFRDPVTATGLSVQPSTKREERMAVAIQFLEDANGDEYCLEEVLARSRRVLNKSYPRPFSQSQDIHVYSEPLKGMYLVVPNR